MAKKSIQAVAAGGNATPRVASEVRSMGLLFGDRGFSFNIGESETANLPGHAKELASAIHSIQRIISQFVRDRSEDPNEEFWQDELQNASVGLEFLSGMVAEMLKVGGAA